MKLVFLSSILFFVCCINAAAQKSPDYIYVEDTVNTHMYKAVKAGNKIWFAENLRSTKFSDGTPIQLCIENNVWDTTSSPSYAYYNNETKSISVFGLLYNYSVIDNNKNVCPDGWRVPSVDDWKSLAKFLGGESNAGILLKSKYNQKWDSITTSNVNPYGFSALPGGYRDFDGFYHDIGKSANYWSSVSADFSSAYSFDIEYEFSGLLEGVEDKKSGLSIRCVSDVLIAK